MAAVKLGVKAGCVALEALGPSLPFPGAEAANLLLKILQMADQALVNADNIGALRDRAAAFLDLLLEYADTLGQKGSYKRTVTQYRELLQDILSYTEEYRSRNVVLKLLLGGSDKARHLELCEELAQLTESVMLTVGVDTNAQVTEALTLLRRQAEYTDRSELVAAQVAAMGGVEAVAADDSKLAAVMALLDSGQALTIATVSNLIKSAQAAGPHRHIRQPDLCLFWQSQYGGEAEVPWAVFWQDFPELMESVGQPKRTALKSLLSHKDAQDRLQQQLERDGNPTRVSVYDLRLAFRGDADVLEEVAAMLNAAAGAVGAAAEAMAAPPTAMPTAMAATAPGGAPPPPAPPAQPPEPAASAGKPAAAAPSQLPPGYRCQLPAVDAAYTGRDSEAAGLVAELCQPGSRAVLLLADGGYGKSSLAIDVGRRLVDAGAVGGGALWADLREAGSAAEVVARVCTAVGAEKEEELPSKLRQLVTRGSLLVVVDNAEDALNAGMEGRAKLVGLLEQLFTATAAGGGGSGESSGAVKLVVTSRPTPQPLELPPGCAAKLETRVVGAMGPEEAAELLRRTCEDLAPEEVRDICAACACVPLVVRLAGEALAAGRTTVKDILQPAAAASATAAAGGGASQTSSQLALVLGCLARKHQLAMAHLCIFPSGFDEDGAGAVLVAPPRQALVTLQLLYRDGMLQYNSVRRQYVMHMAVREAAAALGQRLEPEWGRQAEDRFATYVSGLLAQWGAMYYTAKEWRIALTMARDHENDISKLAKLAAAGNLAAAVALGAVACNAVNSLLDSMGLIKAMRTWLEGAAEALCAAPPGAAPPAAAAGVQLLLSWSLFQLRMHGQGEAAARRAQEIIAGSPDLAEGREGLPIHHRHLGAWALHFLAWNIQRQWKDRDEAERMHRGALELTTQLYSADHPEALYSKNTVAANLNEQGRMADAEPIFKSVLETRVAVLGEEHPNSVMSLVWLAFNVNNQRRYADAEPLYRRVVEIQRRVLGEKHYDTLNSTLLLRQNLEAQGKGAEARALVGSDEEEQEEDEEDEDEED
ncbi:hypothetical protein GPECTOR_17g818 [Gonium pectorale]|uniref:NB-ARC domain-containing protein n=1 Tax=Gonium pectorale TaxID=33097 RepID=A0A150GK75_GONPE|nr:hypothetical protein GPECTOR_17g818 [Gonium pectorale]|eukprot:KXZ50181.1 hypothetical protein GPECTOR_17g818 [Gonium pectorale]